MQILQVELELEASVEHKLRQIATRKVVKLTSHSDIVQRDLKLSWYYVPAISSVHYTVRHSAYSEELSEPRSHPW